MNTTKITPRDFFLHLGAIITLYASLIALVNLAFSIINYTFPDTLANYFYSNSVAWPISILIVLVPALYLLEYFIKKDITKMPEKDTLWVRKWRTYTTLFLTGVVIIIDLITLINIYINGELTERFIYKFLAILIIFSIVFTYYILERYAKTTKSIKIGKIISWAGILIVLISIVGGFAIVGSPFKQRALRMDNQRIGDLSNIQWQIVNHWQRKGKMPKSLEDLKDSISYNNLPKDPETQAPYEYMMTGDMSFQLCSNFSLEYEDTKGRGGSRGGLYTSMMKYPMMDTNESWMHKAGRACFDRAIDPERYPVDNRALLNK